MPESWKDKGSHRWDERGRGMSNPRRHSYHQGNQSGGHHRGGYGQRYSSNRREDGSYHGYNSRHRPRDHQTQSWKSQSSISENGETQVGRRPDAEHEAAPEDSEIKSSIPNWITNLEDELDNKLLVVLRDGRKYIGYLRTFDQFGSIVLEGAVERIIAGNYYFDIDAQCMVIRGENIVLFGAIDESKPSTLEKRPAYEVLELLKKQEEEDKGKPKKSSRFGWSETGDDCW